MEKEELTWIARLASRINEKRCHLLEETPNPKSRKICATYIRNVFIGNSQGKSCENNKDLESPVLKF